MLKHHRLPQDVATIDVSGKLFKVHQALLVKDSDYFEKALNGPSLEGQTQTIDLGYDVSSAHFGVYVDVLYRSYVVKNYVYRAQDSDTRDVVTCRQALWLWRLADRFLNKRFAMIAEEAFSWSMDMYSVSQWEVNYELPEKTDDCLGGLVSSLEKLYEYCVRYSMPQQDQVVAAAANMPMQLLAKYHDGFQTGFRTKVMLKLMKRLENPNLKRPSEQVGGGEASPATAAKRKRVTRSKAREQLSRREKD